MRLILPLMLLIPLILLAVMAPVHSQQPQTPPVLLIKPDPNQPSQPLTISQVDVQVVITNYMAETTMTMRFCNHLNRVLEGDLYFPLPEGSTISGYALDLHDQLVDAVPVGRNEARITFEKEVRKGIDPGIVEWVKGNNFHTRVYPIPAGGCRTVRVRYLSDLVTTPSSTPGASSVDAFYHLPLRFPNPVDAFHIKVETINSHAPPQVREGGPANFKFETWQNRYVAETKLENAQLDHDLVVALPEVPRQQAVVEKDLEGKHTYFCINDIPPAPAPPAAVKPSRIGIAWDASLSREKVDKSREMALLDKILKKLGSAAVDVMLFRNAPEMDPNVWEHPTFNIKNGDSKALLDYLRSVVYDGGTNLGAVPFYRNPTGFQGSTAKVRAITAMPADYGYWLLFTDGLGNLGEEVPRLIQAPVYAISGDARANHALLHFIGQKSGGAYFNIQRLQDNDVVNSVGSPQFSFLSASFDPTQVADVYPRTPQPVHGRFTLAGKLLAPQAVLTLNYGWPGHIAHTVKYTLRGNQTQTTGIAPLAWAQMKIEDLSVFPDQYKDDLLAVGKEFGLVTPGTSLLVLETLDQYLQYHITPPKSQPELYQQYQERIAAQEIEQRKEKNTHLDQVVEMWNRQVKWWQTEFKYPPGFRYTEKKEEGRTLHRLGRAGGGRGRAGGEVVDSAGAASEPAQVASQVPQLRAGAGREPAAAMDLGLAAGKKSKDTDTTEGNEASITLTPWDPQTPYLAALKKASAGEAYKVYLAQRKEYGSSPGFYLDCAVAFFQRQQDTEALRILSNIAELELESPPLLRILAHKLEQEGQVDVAINLFEKVLRMRPEEPQSYRDLALALASRADYRIRAAEWRNRPMEALSDYQRAVGLLNEVVTKEWDGRFPEVEAIALWELNHLVQKARALPSGPTLYLPTDPRLLKLLDVDMRIVLTWDSDLTDMDLWVIEPSGEKCFYSHNLTTIGGAISKDFTQGYGPEVYTVHRAPSGTYQIKANYYGSRQQTLSGPTTLQVTIFTNYGRPGEKQQSITLRLTNPKDVVDVGSVQFNSGHSGP